jgi:DNA-binding PadR family transcriptional regulator
MTVRDGLLALLAERPRNGHQLKVDFEAVTGEVWPLNVGQVYTTLERLERDGLVIRARGGNGAAQKQYELTAAGREELAAWWTLVPVGEPPPRDELVLKILFAIEQGNDRALEVITTHRSALLILLQQRRREQRDRGREPDLPSSLVLDALIVRAEADLRWLDLCEARVTGRTGVSP